MAPKKKTSGDSKDKSKNEAPELFVKRTTPDKWDPAFMLTGNVAFDLAVSDGKGLPIGAFIMLSGGRGCGKSTLCFDILTKLLKKHKDNNIPFKAMHIDIEGSSTLADSFGLKNYLESGELIHYTGQCTFVQLEQLYNSIINKNEATKDIKLIIIDSLALVTTAGMVEKDVEKSHFGIVAKAQSEFMKKFTPLCIEHGITTLLINHEKTEQGSGNTFTGPLKKESGGDAAGYLASVLLRLSKQLGDKTKDKDTKEIEIITASGKQKIQEKFRVVLRSPEKNRFCKIGDVLMLVKSGKGVLDYYTIRELLINNGLITNSGGHYTLVDKIAPKSFKGKKLRLAELNKYIHEDQPYLMEYLRSNNLFKWKISTDTDDTNEIETENDNESTEE